MNNVSESFRGLLLVGSGSLGSIVAVLRPWMENFEYSLRVLLLLLSIASVAVGLKLAMRRKNPPDDESGDRDPKSWD